MKPIDGDEAYKLIESRLGCIDFLNDREDVSKDASKWFEKAIMMALQILNTMPEIK